MKVIITAKQEVRYCKVVEMTHEQYAEIQDAIEREEDDKYFDEIAERYIDPVMDVDEASTYEDVEFYEQKPKQP